MHRRTSESDIVTEHTTSQKVDVHCRDQLLTMGLPADSVDASLASERHDHIYTTYQLLVRKKPRVEAGGHADALAAAASAGVGGERYPHSAPMDGLTEPAGMGMADGLHQHHDGTGFAAPHLG